MFVSFNFSSFLHHQLFTRCPILQKSSPNKSGFRIGVIGYANMAYDFFSKFLKCFFYRPQAPENPVFRSFFSVITASSILSVAEFIRDGCRTMVSVHSSRLPCRIPHLVPISQSSSLKKCMCVKKIVPKFGLWSFGKSP